jgi:hypothetical protein
VGSLPIKDFTIIVVFEIISTGVGGSSGSSDVEVEAEAA